MARARLIMPLSTALLSLSTSFLFISLSTSFLFICSFDACFSLVIPISAAKPAASLQGLELTRVNDGSKVDLGEALASSSASSGEKTMLIIGTHPADFNMIEYCQRAKTAMPQLKEKGVSRFLVVMNGQTSSCEKLVKLLDMPTNENEFEIFSDPTGEAGRKFGVSRGFRPDDDKMSPLLKVTVVGLGFGPPWMTLPAVLPGYFGDPNGSRDWIEACLKQGQKAGRWPTVLELDSDDNIIGNKFDEFPLLSGWGRRPFELATLRLQSLVGIQMKHWVDLKPVDDRCLSQLGGCTVVDDAGEAIYSWVDRGLCDVPDMDEISKAL